MRKKGRKALALGMSLLLATVSMGCSNGEVGEDYPEMPEKDTNNSPPDLLDDEEFLALIEKLNPKLNEVTIKNIASTIEKYSFRYQVPTNLIISVIAAESEFHPNLLGTLDDTGLMQIRLKYASYWAEMMNIPAPQTQGELLDIDTNIHMGTFILQRLLDRYDGNMERVLVAYNAGETYVDKKIKTAQSLPTRYIRRVSNFHMELCNAPVATALEY